MATSDYVSLNGSNSVGFMVVMGCWCVTHGVRKSGSHFALATRAFAVVQSGSWPTLTMLLVVKCKDDGLQRFLFPTRCESDGGYLVQEEKFRVSNRRDEDDDMAPFGWLNFELLDHDTCQHMVGQN